MVVADIICHVKEQVQPSIYLKENEFIYMTMH